MRGLGAPISWVEPKVWLRGPPLTLAMPVGTMNFVATCAGFALVHAEVIRVVLLLLPAVTVATAVLQLTPVRISLRLFLCRPKLALLFAFVLEKVRLSPIVLPIVCILTLISLMTFAFVVEGTPDRFKIKHVEVCIRFHLVQHVNREFFL